MKRRITKRPWVWGFLLPCWISVLNKRCGPRCGNRNLTDFLGVNVMFSFFLSSNLGCADFFDEHS